MTSSTLDLTAEQRERLAATGGLIARLDVQIEATPGGSAVLVVSLTYRGDDDNVGSVRYDRTPIALEAAADDLLLRHVFDEYGQRLLDVVPPALRRAIARRSG